MWHVNRKAGCNAHAKEGGLGHISLQNVCSLAFYTVFIGVYPDICMQRIIAQ